MDGASKESSFSIENKAIELRYNSFMNQLMAAKDYLMQLGISVSNDDYYDVKHKSLQYVDWVGDHYNECFMDDFYHSVKDFVGLNGKSCIIKDEKQ